MARKRFTRYLSRVTRYFFQLAIRMFSIKMAPVGAIRSGMSEQDDTSDGAHNAMTHLTMGFAIPRREGNGQFCFHTPLS